MSSESDPSYGARQAYGGVPGLKPPYKPDPNTLGGKIMQDEAAAARARARAASAPLMDDVKQAALWVEDGRPVDAVAHQEVVQRLAGEKNRLMEDLAVCRNHLSEAQYGGYRKKRSGRRKSTKRKSTRRKSTKRKSTKRKSTKKRKKTKSRRR